jgi:hypothetical protein
MHVQNLSIVESEAAAVFNPFISLAVNSALLGVEAQQVIALRMLRLAAGGAAAKTEMQRMVSEKMIAAAAAATDAATAGLTGKSGPAIAHQAIRGYRKRVRANKRRLNRS